MVPVAGGSHLGLPQISGLPTIVLVRSSDARPRNGKAHQVSDVSVEYRSLSLPFTNVTGSSRRTSAAKPYFDFKDGRLTLENVPVPPPLSALKESSLLM